MKPEWLCLFYFERVCPDQGKKKILCKLKVSSFGMWVQKWEGKVQKLFAASISFFLDGMQLISILQICWAREKLTLCPNHCAHLFSSSPDFSWLDQQHNWTVWAIIISLSFQMRMWMCRQFWAFCFHSPLRNIQKGEKLLKYSKDQSAS